jgi:hypothetical protein
MIHSSNSPFAASAAPSVMCLIIDASVEPNLLAHLQSQIGLPDHQCVALFHGTSYVGLQAAGPYALLCQGPGGLADFASEVLERSPAGFAGQLHGEQDFPHAVEHCRQLLTVSSDDTPARLMRFYDPRWLEPLFGCLSEAEQRAFMGPFASLYWRNELDWRQCVLEPDQTIQPLDAPAWLHLDPQRQALIVEHRLSLVAQRLAPGYQPFFTEADDPTAVVLERLKAAQQAGFSDLALQERWLRLTFSRREPFWQLPACLDLLASDDLTADEKLDALERL